MHIPSIMSKVSLLKFHPEWVDGGPGLPGPVFRTALTEYVVAGLVREITTHLINAGVHEAVSHVRSKLKCPLFVACEMSGFKVVPSPSGPGWFWGWGCRGRGQSLFPCLVL